MNTPKTHTHEIGATLVEYAMLITLVAIIAMAAIDRLNVSATQEMETRSQCVAAIPGSPEAAVCGYRPTTTTIFIP